jgi:hypothetical protein
MKRLLLFVLGITFGLPIFAQLAKDQVVFMQAEVSENPPSIRLHWPQESWTGQYILYKRNSIDTTDWGAQLISLSGADTSYLDTNVVLGEDYEYHITKTLGASNYALGYLRSGVNKDLDDETRNLALMIDSVLAAELPNEIEDYEESLRNEGWNLSHYIISPSADVMEVKDSVFQAYFDLNTKLTSILILGHVAVPYSGDYSRYSPYPSPDGHVEGAGNHTGAWPADVFYADIDGDWTDNNVNRTSGSQSRHHNTPGDGKFDPTKLPSDLEFEVGRIDLSNMPEFSADEVELTRRYLERNLAFRRGELVAERRALVDNNFGSLNLASTGWHNFISFFPRDSVRNADYFTEMKSGSYLWSYGCGAGSYTSCSGVGRTSDFAADSLQSVFTVLAGSYFGDWDIQNNLLRAPLANGALSCFWGGIPKWYMHHMALGGHLGWGARRTQNNNGEYYTGNFNFSANEVHIALMGDPSLRMYYPAAPSNLVLSTATNKVIMDWSASADPDVVGYYTYRYDSLFKEFIRLSDTVITALNFVDKNNTVSGEHTYLVRALRLEETASGTYYSGSMGSSAKVTYTFDPTVGMEVDVQEVFNLQVFPNPNAGRFKVELRSIAEKRLTLKLIDLKGQMVWIQDWNISGGFNQNILQLPELSEGLYLLQVQEGAASLATQRIVIRK